MRLLRSTLAPTGLALLAAAALAGPAGATSITEFPPVAGSGGVQGIAAGPDGNVWFTEAKNRIGRITMDGTVKEFSAGITAGAYPLRITAGSDGNLWFTEFNGNRIGRITPAGVVTEFSTGITPASFPRGITAGPDGNVWFTESQGQRIGRITPAGAITEFPAAGNPWEITTGPDGNLWFTEYAGNRIAKITPEGIVSEFLPLIAGSAPSGIVAGPDGNLWFTEYSGSRVGKITTAGKVTDFSNGSGVSTGSHPQGIAAGADGNLWFAEARQAASIGRITPSAVATEFSTGVTPGSFPEGIVSGPDGNLWFTESDATNGSRIGRVNLELPPVVTTGDASAVGTSAATVSGAVLPIGAVTSYAFEYGLTDAYGSATTSKTLPAGGTAVAVTADLGNLRPATTYHYRLVASNAFGTKAGTDRTFTTTATGATGGGGGGTTPLDRTGPTMQISGTALRLSSRGSVGLKITCPLSETLGCRGTVSLQTAGLVRVAARRRLQLGNASFRLGGGRSATVKIHISRRGRSIIRRAGRLRVTAAVTASDASGNRKTTSKSLTIRPNRRSARR